MGNKPAYYSSNSSSISLKIVLLGNAKVGKSAIMVQFYQNIFVEKYDPTIENSYRKVIELDGRAAYLEVFDCEGTEQFTAMRDLYIRNANGLVLVYSVTDKQSFESCPELYKQVLNVRDAASAPVILVGNKSDLTERVVSIAEGEELAKQNGWPFFETSAKDKNSVDKIIHEISRQAIESQQRDGIKM